MYPDLTNWLIARGYGEPRQQRPVRGGCINAALHLTFADGRHLFLKHNASAPAGMFESEAQGLCALRDVDALVVPEVLLAAPHFLLLEDLGRSQPDARFWTELGHGLARLHAGPQPAFGFTVDNYCGSTPQHNPQLDDGWDFFARHRLLALGELARERGLLDRNELHALEWIAGRLRHWIPPLPAALIHGDLWSGNIHCAADGRAALIDPACYWGWAEADLAMTLLFGGFAVQFYSAYAESGSLAPGWRERVPLYNLYHLLNHLLLFGATYHAQIRETLDRYAAS